MQKLHRDIVLAILLPLFLLLPAAGSDKQYEANRMSYYAPQLLPSVDDAAGKIIFLQPHVYATYGKMAVVSKRVTVDRNGVNFIFAPPGNMAYEEHTESIQFAKAVEIEAWAGPVQGVYYYNVQASCTDGLQGVFTDSVERAHMLEDAILTMAVASGSPSVFASDFSLGYLTARELKSLKLDFAFPVTTMQKAGPAETAGLKSGDIIVGLNGGSAQGIWQILAQGVRDSPSGYTAHLSLLRDKKPLEIAVTYKALWTAQQVAALRATSPNADRAGAAPAPAVASIPTNTVFLGVRTHNITASEAQAAGLADAQGILVDQIAPGSLAEQARVLPGDVILALDGKPAVTINDMKAILQLGTPSNIMVWRNGKKLTLIISQSL